MIDIVDYKNGKVELGEFLVANNGLIAMVLKQMAIYEYDQRFEDYFQVGYIGLMKAAQRFDIGKGFKFSTFAIKYVEGEIKLQNRSVSEKGMKQSRLLKEIFFRYKKMKEVGKTEEEIIENLGIKKEKLKKAIQMCNMVENSLDEPFKIDKDGKIQKLGDSIATKENLEDNYIAKESFKFALNQIKIKLSQGELDILKLRLSKMSQSEIAIKMNTTQVTISRRLRKIKKIMENELQLVI